MQLSLDLSPVQKLPSFKNVSKAFVPLVWIEMVGDIAAECCIIIINNK
jgi:hypothetical protein